MTCWDKSNKLQLRCLTSVELSGVKNKDKPPNKHHELKMMLTLQIVIFTQSLNSMPFAISHEILNVYANVSREHYLTNP